MSTISLTCPLCGLRYADRPLLDLHIREDHVQRERAREPRPDESGDAGLTRQTTPPVAPPGPAASASPAARTALNRVILALRHLHRETMHASERLIFRATPPCPQTTTAVNDARAVNDAPFGEQQRVRNAAPARSQTPAASGVEHTHQAA